MAKKSIFKKSEEEVGETLEAVAEEFGEVVKEEVKAKPAKAEKTVAEKDDEMVEIDIPVHVKIAGKRLQPGKHVVPRHQSRDIIAIVNKKMKADLQALSVTSKSYLVNRALSGAINVKEVAEIKFK